MTSWNLATAPSSGGGATFDKNDALDHLIIFGGPLEGRDMDTVHGPARAVHCEFVLDVDALRLYGDVLIFGAALAPRLEEAGTDLVIGRLGKGLAKPGKSAAWILDDATEGDIAEASALLDKVAVKAPSGRFIIDSDALEAEAAKLGDF